MVSRPGNAKSGPPQKSRSIELPNALSVRELSELLDVSPVNIIKQLMRTGIMANINQVIGYDSAVSVATGLGFEVRQQAQATRKSPIRELKQKQLQPGKETAGFKTRPPVVTVMGHVDHGKTRLLDAIRKTNVMATEAGGITQHIGAYQVEVAGHKVTFLDTPGHQAFTAMRARGAQVTDVAILVVAADDGVMPQTLEAIDHARAAGVPIIVALNKIDKPEANPERVKQQLADAGLVIEEWGGETLCIPVSARENKGIPQLLESILLVAEMEDLKADPNRPAAGIVIEAELDKTKGPLATVLVNNGTLRIGDTLVVGNTWGRVKAMFNDEGKQIRRAGPSTPVVILGLNNVPQVGDSLAVVADEKLAKSLIQEPKAEQKAVSQKSVNLSNLFDQVSAGQVKELNIILETDVQGSIEPIRNSLEQLSTDEVKVRIIRTASGTITESDVMLAIASKGIIIGFNTTAEPGAQKLAELEGISIRYYNVIYNMVDDVSKALKGMLKPAKIEVTEGQAEVRAVFPMGKTAKIAGVYVTEGKVSRGASVRVRRQNKIIADSTVSSLKRFKEDAREVAAGYECGVGIQDFNDIQVGDILEFYRITEAA
ncbi:MAG: translation initiation factor IF-2 [Chloroflexota bacterium]